MMNSKIERQGEADALSNNDYTLEPTACQITGLEREKEIWLYLLLKSWISISA